jgi:hypothetical protein
LNRIIVNLFIAYAPSQACFGTAPSARRLKSCINVYNMVYLYRTFRKMIARHLTLEMAGLCFPYKAKSSNEELIHHRTDGINQ